MEVEQPGLWDRVVKRARNIPKTIPAPVTQTQPRPVTWTGKEGQEIGLPTPDEPLIISGAPGHFALRDGPRGVMYCGEHAFLLLVLWRDRDNLDAGMLAAPAGRVFYA